MSFGWDGVKVRKREVIKPAYKKLNGVIRRERQRRTIFSQHNRRLRWIELEHKASHSTFLVTLSALPGSGSTMWEFFGTFNLKAVTTIDNVFRLRSRTYKSQDFSPPPRPKPRSLRFPTSSSPLTRVWLRDWSKSVRKRGIGRSREEVGHGLISNSDLPRPNDRRRRDKWQVPNITCRSMFISLSNIASN